MYLPMRNYAPFYYTKIEWETLYFRIPLRVDIVIIHPREKERLRRDPAGSI